MTALSRRVLLGNGAALALTASRSWAQTDPPWPVRTVRLISLAAAGGGTDAVARVLAEALAKRWGQPVIVDNRPGGEGIVSIETFLAAREGNHTLLFNPSGHMDDAASGARAADVRYRPRSRAAIAGRTGFSRRCRLAEACGGDTGGGRPAGACQPGQDDLGKCTQRSLPRLHGVPQGAGTRTALRALPQSARLDCRSRRGASRPDLAPACPHGRTGAGRQAQPDRRGER